MQLEHSHCVFSSSYSKRGTRSIPPSSSAAFPCQGISDLQGSLPPSCCFVTCSSPQHLCQRFPAGQAWVAPCIPARLAAWGQHHPRARGLAGFQVLCQQLWHKDRQSQTALPTMAFIQKLGELGAPKGIFRTE